MTVCVDTVSGTNLGEKLQTAHNNANPGEVLDCRDLTGAQFICSTVTLSKPVQVLFGQCDISCKSDTDPTCDANPGIKITIAGVSLVGAGPSLTKLHAPAGTASSPRTIIQTTADYLTLDQLDIRFDSGNSGNTDDMCVKIGPAPAPPASPTPPPPPPPCSIPNTGNINGFRIANCTITGATKKETGIHVIQGFLGLIENCYIKGFDKGIHFVGTGDCATGGCVIRACRIEANNTGLEYDELISGTLVGNTIQDNSRPSPDYGIGLLVTNGANLTSVGNHYENKVLPEDIDVKIVAGNAMNFVGDKFNSSNPGKNLVYSGGNFVYIRGGKLIGGVTATGNNAAGDNANIVQELVERVTSASDLGPGHHVRLKMEWPELIGLRAKEWRMWKPMPVPPDPPGAVYTEYGYLRWSGNVFALGTETNAGGSGRELRLQAGNKEVVVWDSRLSIVQNEGAPALSVNGSGGQKWNVSQKSELTTIGTGSVTETWTDTGIKIPANAVVFGVSVRVVEAIPNPVPPIPGLDPSFMVTGAADTSPVFSTVDDVPTAAGSTDVGTKNCPYKNGAAELAIRIKPNYNPPTAAGKVRVTIHYYEITP